MSKKTVKVTSRGPAKPPQEVFKATEGFFQRLPEDVPVAPTNANRLARLAEEIRLDLGYIKANLYLQARAAVAAALIFRGTPQNEVVQIAKDIVEALDPQLEFERAKLAAEQEKA